MVEPRWTRVSLARSAPSTSRPSTRLRSGPDSGSCWPAAAVSAPRGCVCWTSASAVRGSLSGVCFSC
ncbi:MAG: hypothetical protein LBE67_10075 [Kocuria palustris]|nr:hypothetical protein [Kocuria palustris]